MQSLEEEVKGYLRLNKLAMVKPKGRPAGAHSMKWVETGEIEADASQAEIQAAF